MNTPTALAHPRLLGHRPARPIRLRLDATQAFPALPALRPTTAAHDFLVPNPRPDLTMELATLRMLEAG